MKKEHYNKLVTLIGKEKADAVKENFEKHKEESRKEFYAL